MELMGDHARNLEIRVSGFCKNNSIHPSFQEAKLKEFTTEGISCNRIREPGQGQNKPPVVPVNGFRETRVFQLLCSLWGNGRQEIESCIAKPTISRLTFPGGPWNPFGWKPALQTACCNLYR
jgi:hypothetical protein